MARWCCGVDGSDPPPPFGLQRAADKYLDRPLGRTARAPSAVELSVIFFEFLLEFFISFFLFCFGIVVGWIFFDFF